ncbi:MAG: hypothetical protein JXR31_15190 [Prolixibacteraceae bacterium]|nr:hypothetical protein [Prolixibacteraceae bacterium]
MKKILRFVYKVLTALFPSIIWYRYFLKNNKEHSSVFPFKEKIWAARKGFMLSTIVSCNITKENHENYLSDRRYFDILPINGKFSKIIDSKLNLPYLLKDFPHLIPEYYYFINDGRPVQLNKKILEPDIITFFQNRNKTVLKPCRLSKGSGFYLLENKGGKFYLNNKLISKEKLNDFIKDLDDYIVTEYISQHKEMSEFNESSANTLRFLFVWDDVKNEYFIPASYQRFGMNGKLVDNTGSGSGIAALVDLDTGIIDTIGLIRDDNITLKRIEVTKHPNSQKQIAGFKLPHFMEIKSRLTEIMNSISFIRYACLDLIITDDGFKIIEINSMPTLTGMQMGKGLLADERLKLFFSGIKK